MPDSARFVEDFAKTQEDKDLLSVLDAEDEVGRPFVVSKDIPADRLAILRAGFDGVMKDPGFLAEMEKQQLPVHPYTGAESEKLMAKMLNVPPAIIQRARKIYE